MVHSEFHKPGLSLVFLVLRITRLTRLTRNILVNQAFCTLGSSLVFLVGIPWLSRLFAHVVKSGKPGSFKTLRAWLKSGFPGSKDNQAYQAYQEYPG